MNTLFYVRLKENYEEYIGTENPELYRYVKMVRESFDPDGIYPVLSVNPSKVTLRRDNHIEQTETTLFLLPDKNKCFQWVPFEFFSFLETFSK